ncbi:hypothetical protein A3A66_00540 [Microgenomates group bacterium RIFCSPLOWO2_01_FULL_46_13]|nr:MAG: hypothetical protein A2783_04020 [Microgenomates group bacterium RIFCSPHIGHO2_01_FULL_45_11]OGV94501.1 MAG: hypothetical protein A3A66_00540 [Microgenomates group bacterium RIFCSPLOWO2_01_FULL_46_13]
MATKIFVPQEASDWDNYWRQANFKQELAYCETDGLLPIFNRFLNEKQRILEAGCGLGKWIVYWSKCDYNIVGVDTNGQALRRLKRRYPEVMVTMGDVNRLPVLSEIFDVYISLGVIEHFRKGPEVALAEAFRVLKPGGTAIIEVPIDNIMRKWWRFLSGGIRVVKLPARWIVDGLGLRAKRKVANMTFYEYRYTASELAGFIRAAGLELMELLPKDDLAKEKSIGLWLDFPRLRASGVADFSLKPIGQLIKRWYDRLGWQSVYSACVVGVARKPT